LQLTERGFSPEAFLKKYWDQPQRASFHARDASLDLHSKAIIGGEKLWTKKHQHEMRGLEALAYLGIPIGARLNSPIVPFDDLAVPFERRELNSEAVSQLFVGMRIGVECLPGHAGSPFGGLTLGTRASQGNRPPRA
jgi:hypothetical protein